MENLLNSIKAVLYERTVSPLFGTLFLSWLAWNYRAVLIVFSELEVKDKIEHIETVLYPSVGESLLFLVVLPISTAIFFIYVFPFPARWVHQFWRARQKELRDDRLSIEQATLLTVEESQKIRQRVLEVQAEYDRVLRQTQSDLDGTKEQLDNAGDEIARLERELSETKSKLLRAEEPDIIEEEVLDSILRSRPYRLYYRPEVGRDKSKPMMFGPSGTIVEGRNRNEDSWRITDGKLELLNEDGGVHTRFRYDPDSMVFSDTNDSDTNRDFKGKFMIPEPDAASA